LVCDDCSGFILIARYQKRKGGWNITEEGTDLRHCCVVTDPVDGQKSYAPCTSRRTVSSAEVSRSVIFNTLAALPKDRNHSRGLSIKYLQHALVADQLSGATANVVKKALKKVKLGSEDHLELWKQINPYLACFQDSNPGAIGKATVNEETNEIEDIIVVMPYTDIFGACYQVIGIDAAHLHSQDVTLAEDKSRFLSEQFKFIMVSGRTAWNKMIILDLWLLAVKAQKASLNC